MKFDSNWPRSFREEVFENVDIKQTNDLKPRSINDLDL